MIKHALSTVFYGVTLGFAASALVLGMTKPARSAEFECTKLGTGILCVSVDSRTGIHYLTASDQHGKGFALKAHCENQIFTVTKNDFNYSQQYFAKLAREYCVAS